MYVEWTRTHAHFLQMGGFRLRCTREDKDLYTNILQFHYARPDGTWEGVLTYRAFTHFLGTGRLACPRASLSEAEIMDGLSKTVAVLQLLWFVLQLVGRAGVGLDGDDGGADDGRAGRWSLRRWRCIGAGGASRWMCSVLSSCTFRARRTRLRPKTGGTGVPSESSGHVEVPDAEDGLSANQVFVPQGTIQPDISPLTLPIPETDKERLESQEWQDDLEGKRAQGHHRSLVRSVAQLASKARATLSRMTILTHKAHHLSKWLPRSLVWLQSHLAPLAAGYIIVWPVEAITGSATIEHNRYASGARATSSSTVCSAPRTAASSPCSTYPTPISTPGLVKAGTGAGAGA